MTQKILIVDDEPNILISLEYLMQREGFDVRVARDGLQAVEAIERDPPDLVLLDIMMPGKTGLEVCQHLRSIDRLRHVIIILLTAKGRETDVAKGLALGANAYVTKPFSTRELVTQVRALLQAPP
ncbi:MAG: response regulator [Betaproteobacteria bacterium]